MQITNQETYKYTFPAYALSYLINGDASGLTDKEIKDVDEFVERENYIKHFDYDYEEHGEPYFSKYPEFGLACDCVDLIGITWTTS